MISHDPGTLRQYCRRGAVVYGGTVVFFDSIDEANEVTFPVDSEQSASTAVATERSVFKTRAEKVMFVKGDDNLSFSDVAQVIDIAHSADLSMKIGLITAKVESGQ